MGHSQQKLNTVLGYPEVVFASYVTGEDKMSSEFFRMFYLHEIKVEVQMTVFH